MCKIGLKREILFGIETSTYLKKNLFSMRKIGLEKELFIMLPTSLTLPHPGFYSMQGRVLKGEGKQAMTHKLNKGAFVGWHAYTVQNTYTCRERILYEIHVLMWSIFKGTFS